MLRTPVVRWKTRHESAQPLGQDLREELVVTTEADLFGHADLFIG